MRTRALTWIFLVLACCFFGIRHFRWAVTIPVTEIHGRGRLDQPSWPMRDRVEQGDLRKLVVAAERKRDASDLVFAALYLDDPAESVRTAEEAVSIDPAYTWVLYQLGSRWFEHSCIDERQPPPVIAGRISDWLARLKLWAPNNSVPYLLETAVLRCRAKDLQLFVAHDAAQLKTLAGQTAYMATMQQAFAHSDYDSYSVPGFDLRRRVLAAHHWDDPVRLERAAGDFYSPFYLTLRSAALVQVQYVAATRAQQGDRASAEMLDEEVAHFGRRMRFADSPTGERLAGAEIERLATESLLQMAVAAGDTAEATRLRERLEALTQARAGLLDQSNTWSLEYSHQVLWNFLALHTLAVLVVVFGFLSCCAVGYVSLRGVWGPQPPGRLTRALARIEAYLVILFFASCIGLALVYAPYADDYDDILAGRTPVHSVDLLVAQSYPLAERESLCDCVNETANPFLLYPPIAAVGLAGLGLIALSRKWRGRKKMAAAAGSK